MEDEQFLSGRARKFVLSSTLMRDACASRLDIIFKHDLTSVKMYEGFYNKIGVGLYTFFTILNLLTILLEYPTLIYINNKPCPYYIPMLINIICEAYFYYRWYVIYTVSQKESFNKNTEAKMTVIILVIMSLDTIVYAICQELNFNYKIRWSRALRPILLLTFPENRKLRAAFYNLRSTTMDVLPVFGLFMTSILFLTIVSVTLIGEFRLKDAKGLPYFQDASEVLWELYVLTTTANSPDVILPAYEKNPCYVTIYVATSVICNWLFMGIITASVYNSYRSHLCEFVAICISKRKEKLDEAFDLISTMTPDGHAGISQGTFSRLLRIVKPNRSETSSRILFHVLDKSRSGYLTKNEFGRLSSYLQVRLVEVELSRTYFQTFLPKFYNIYHTKTFQKIKYIIEHRITRLFFSFLILCNGITAVFCRRYIHIQETLEWLFTIMFLLEILLNYLACGGVKYFHDGWNIFDCVIVFSALVTQIIHFLLSYLDIHLPMGLIQMFLLFRLFRLLKLIRKVKSFRIVVNCIITILPSLSAYITILLIIFYTYTCFAMVLYHDAYKPPINSIYYPNTTCSNYHLRNTEFVKWHYCNFNFNSAPESFLLLLILSVGNNWHIFADGYSIVSSKWTRLFFVIIHWTCVLLVLNVVLAFIIEAFLIEFESPQSKFESYLEERLDELGMNARIELAKRGLANYDEQGFIIDAKLLDEAFPPNSPRGKAFFLEKDSSSSEVLLFRMFEKEIEDLMDNYVTGKRSLTFRAHDTLATLNQIN